MRQPLPEGLTYPTTRRFGLRVAESWFDEPIIIPGVDIVRLEQRYRRPERIHVTERATLLTNLGEAEQALWNAMSKENRYEVRRARARDGLTIEMTDRPSPEQLDAFVAYFNAFAQSKGMSALSATNRNQLRSYRGARRLVLSAIQKDEQQLVWHSYYAAPGDTCRLLHSASLFRRSEDSAFRALVGRANRLLHWEEVCWFREQEYRRFDWGGWHAGADPTMLRINHFKESFGGTVIPVYFGELGSSLLGRLACGLLHRLRRGAMHR